MRTGWWSHELEGAGVSEDCIKPLYWLWTGCLRTFMKAIDLLLFVKWGLYYSKPSPILAETDQKMDRQ